MTYRISLPEFEPKAILMPSLTKQQPIFQAVIGALFMLLVVAAVIAVGGRS